MIKKFEEFINESNEQFILSIELNSNESSDKTKLNIDKIVETGEGDNKIVLTKYNTPDAFFWSNELFLYPFFNKEEAEAFISEFINQMNIYEYNIFPATKENPLMKHFLNK